MAASWILVHKSNQIRCLYCPTIGVSRICGADLQICRSRSHCNPIGNASRKCGADLLRICMRGRIYAANPLRGCLEISIFIPPTAWTAVMLYFWQQIWCRADRNIQIYVSIILWSGLYLCWNWTPDLLWGCKKICGSGCVLDFMLGILQMNILRDPYWKLYIKLCVTCQ